MIHEIRCLRCNGLLLEPTEVAGGSMIDTARIPPGLLYDEASGRYCKTCPHCAAKNLFREYTVPGRTGMLLLDRLAE